MTCALRILAQPMHALKHVEPACLQGTDVAGDVPKPGDVPKRAHHWQALWLVLCLPVWGRSLNAWVTGAGGR